MVFLIKKTKIKILKTNKKTGERALSKRNKESAFIGSFQQWKIDTNNNNNNNNKYLLEESCTFFSYEVYKLIILIFLLKGFR